MTKATKEGRTRRWGKHPTGICTVPSCEREHVAAGLCGMHYQRRKRGGTVGTAVSRFAARIAKSGDQSRHVDRTAPQFRESLRRLTAAAKKESNLWPVKGNRSEFRPGRSRVSFHISTLMALARRGWIRLTDGDTRTFTITKLGKKELASKNGRAAQ